LQMLISNTCTSPNTIYSTVRKYAAFEHPSSFDKHNSLTVLPRPLLNCLTDWDATGVSARN
jgi:hypothetical protein